jgi:hypothetical protein
MPQDEMKQFVEDLENRVNKTRGKYELVKLREEITIFIKSPKFRELLQIDQDRVEDLLVKVISKEERHKVRDSWQAILNR